MKKLLIVAVGAIVIGGLSAAYLYNKGHANTRTLEPVFELSAEALFSEYGENEGVSNKKYLDQVIVVTGVIKEIRKENEIVNIQLKSDHTLFGVVCQMDEKESIDFATLTEGSSVSIKGICTGLLMDVVLIRCVHID